MEGKREENREGTEKATGKTTGKGSGKGKLHPLPLKNREEINYFRSRGGGIYYLVRT